MMIRFTCGRVARSSVRCLLERIDGWPCLAFDGFVKHHYSRHAFEHVARIDLPTFMDPSVSQPLDTVSLKYGFCSVGRTIDSLLRSGCSILVLLTQISVLVTIPREQGIGSFLSLLPCLRYLVVCALSQMELGGTLSVSANDLETNPSLSCSLQHMRPRLGIRTTCRRTEAAR